MFNSMVVFMMFSRWIGLFLVTVTLESSTFAQGPGFPGQLARNYFRDFLTQNLPVLSDYYGKIIKQHQRLDTDSKQRLSKIRDQFVERYKAILWLEQLTLPSAQPRISDLLDSFLETFEKEGSADSVLQSYSVNAAQVNELISFLILALSSLESITTAEGLAELNLAIEHNELFLESSPRLYKLACALISSKVQVSGQQRSVLAHAGIIWNVAPVSYHGIKIMPALDLIRSELQYMRREYENSIDALDRILSASTGRSWLSRITKSCEGSVYANSHLEAWLKTKGR